MPVVDSLIFCFIAVAAVFGLIRGVVSQIMSLAGLVAAYFVAPWGGVWLGPWAQSELGCSRFMAEKSSVFLVGFAVYLGVRLLGYGIEKLVINRVKGFWKLNRIGGALLGGTKAVALIVIVFFFLALIPVELVRGTVPKLLESRVYHFAAAYNPMGKQATLEKMRRLRVAVLDPRRTEKLKGDPAMGELLKRHDLKTALNDQRFVQALREGDYDQLRKVERVEEFMNDEKLGQLLTQLGPN